MSEHNCVNCRFFNIGTYRCMQYDAKYYNVAIGYLEINECEFFKERIYCKSCVNFYRRDYEDDAPSRGYVCLSNPDKFWVDATYEEPGYFEDEYEYPHIKNMNNDCSEYEE